MRSQADSVGYAPREREEQELEQQRGDVERMHSSAAWSCPQHSTFLESETRGLSQWYCAARRCQSAERQMEKNSSSVRCGRAFATSALIRTSHHTHKTKFIETQCETRPVGSF